MIRVAGVLLALAFYIYSIIDVLRSPKSQVRTLPKYVWLEKIRSERPRRRSKISAQTRRRCLGGQNAEAARTKPLTHKPLRGRPYTPA